MWRYVYTVLWIQSSIISVPQSCGHIQWLTVTQTTLLNRKGRLNCSDSLQFISNNWFILWKKSWNHGGELFEKLWNICSCTCNRMKCWNFPPPQGQSLLSQSTCCQTCLHTLSKGAATNRKTGMKWCSFTSCLLYGWVTVCKQSALTGMEV